MLHKSKAPNHGREHESRPSVGEPKHRTNSRVIFPHKRRPDGIYESICTRCFITVGSRIIEDDLVESENAHVCLGLNLSELLRPKVQK
jgi:hypothetical protein